MMTMSCMTSVVTSWALPSMLKIRKIASKFTRPVEQGWEVKCTGRVAEKHFICKGKNFVVIRSKPRISTAMCWLWASMKLFFRLAECLFRELIFEEYEIK